MPKIDFRPHTSVEPEPTYATNADIALAEELRHRLEERYFGGSTAPAALQAESGEND